jgi:hypothetical protein
MILINLKEERILLYEVTDIKRVKDCHLVFIVPNTIKLNEVEKPINHTQIVFLTDDNIQLMKIDGIIEDNGIKVIVPPLIDVINQEMQIQCYLELEDTHGVIHKVSEDTVTFQFEPVFNLKFHEAYKSPKKAKFIQRNNNHAVKREEAVKIQ